MDEYGRYYKLYNFEDGAIWFENMCPIFESFKVEVKKLEIEVEVKLLRTEFYSTEDSKSKFYYEKF